MWNCRGLLPGIDHVRCLTLAFGENPLDEHAARIMPLTCVADHIPKLLPMPLFRFEILTELNVDMILAKLHAKPPIENER